MKAEDFTYKMRVRYIPGVAHGDRNHPDCEDGTVSSNNGKYVFVKFDKQLAAFGGDWEAATSESCCCTDLVRL